VSYMLHIIESDISSDLIIALISEPYSFTFNAASPDAWIVCRVMCHGRFQ